MKTKIQTKETVEKTVWSCDWCKTELEWLGQGFRCLSCGRVICSNCFCEKKNLKSFEGSYGHRFDSTFGEGQSRQRADFCTDCLGRGRDRLIIALLKDEQNEQWILEQFREYRRRQQRTAINAEIERREKWYGFHF